MPNIWPFYKKPKPVPEAVNELNLVNADGSPASFPQYWKRNTLVIDLSGVGWRHGQRSPRACRRRPPGRCAWRCACVRAASGRSRSRAKSAMCCRWPPKARAHRPRVRAQRVHAEDGGYLHFLGTDAGVRGSRARPSPRRRHSCRRPKCRSPRRAAPEARAPATSSRPPKRSRSAFAAARLLMRAAGQLHRLGSSASRLTAVSAPPHTQPVSSASRSRRRLKPSVDQ